MKRIISREAAKDAKVPADGHLTRIFGRQIARNARMDDSTWPTGIRSKAAMLLGLVVVVVCSSGCVTQRLIDRARPQSHWETPPPWFSENDIRDPDSLIRKIRAKADPVSEFLNQSMRPDVRAMFEKLPSSSTNSDRATLATVLNSIMSLHYIYDSNRFQNVKLRPETLEVMKQSGEQTRANRLVLEDAYPSEFSKLPGTHLVIDHKAAPGLYLLMPAAVATDIVLSPLYLCGVILLATGRC